MQPTYVSLLKVFGSAERHSVPLFQRPYVWNEEDNWEPLWQDLSDLADRILLSPDKAVRGHFLGTVVLEQVASKIGSIATREIIDGQQRLTTLQLLLQAVQHAMREIEKAALEAHDDVLGKIARDAGRRIASLTTNVGYDDEEKYKVWPTNEDRAAYRQVMDAEGPNELQGVSTRMASAYAYFYRQVRKWLEREPPANRIPALDAAVKDSLRLIVLDLDKSDEPQAIFETLNAHGTPLLPADLIKNWLLWEAAGGSVKLDTLYQKYWLSFDRAQDFWRAEVGTGHAARARIDTFLQNWLTMRCREFIPVKHLYDRFTHQMDRERTADDGTVQACDVSGVMGDIDAHAKRFQYIDMPQGKTRFDTFLRRLSTLNLVVFHPFLLALMARTASDEADRDRIAVILESYLMRRMICNLETRGYGTLCISLLGALVKADTSGPASAEILNLLCQDAGKAIVWPSDEAFGRDWLRRQFYGSIRRERVVMLLRAIEEHYQAHDLKAEPILHFDYTKLQIEHIMPQSWREHWLVEGEEAARVRETKINTIGNLTLVSGKLNPTLSNAPWTSLSSQPNKRHGLEEHSMLRLNAHLVKKDVWDEESIELRAKALFEVARAIWVSPHNIL